jgi:hypothetical protein
MVQRRNALGRGLMPYYLWMRCKPKVLSSINEIELSKISVKPNHRVVNSTKRH